MSAIATHPKQAEPIPSRRDDETLEGGQTVTVSFHFADGSHDVETERVGAFGDWIAPEIKDLADENLVRTLRRRNRAQFGIGDAP